jgi:hypothetical protein
MPREWLRPIHTDNVPTYGDEPCTWTYEGIKGELYYQIHLAPLGSLLGKPSKETPRYSIVTSELDLRGRKDMVPRNIDAMVRIFDNKGATSTVDTVETRNARDAVIQARKKLLSVVKAKRAERSSPRQEPTHAPSQEQEPTLEPTHAFKDDFDTLPG